MTITPSPTVPTRRTRPHDQVPQPLARTHETGTCSDLLAAFADRVGADRVARYFEHAARARRDGDALRIAVRTAFDADWLRRTFGEDLRAAASETVGEIAIQWVVEPGAFASEADEASASAPSPLAGPCDPPPPKRPAAPSAAADGSPWERGPRYRFDDFVVGESNRLAFVTGQRLVEQSASISCAGPLFLHGGCAVGKTHLLHAIAGEFRERYPQSRVCCMTAEMFTNEFIAAVYAKRLDAFRKRYRGLDLLCIDDLQFLAGKSKTQSELLHTIEALDLEQGRLVLAADEHPKRLDRTCARLISRCVSGMVARLEGPERELRIRLAQRLAAQRGLTLEPAAASVVADACAGSVRDIEGGIVRLDAVVRLEHLPGPVTAVLARRVLGRGDLMRPRKPISVPQVTCLVCAELNVELSEVLGRGRHRLVVLARSMAALLSRELTTMSYPEIARALNRKNHSTVVTACQRLRRQMEEGREQDAGPLQGTMPLSDLYARLHDAIVRSAASGTSASVA